MKHLQAVFVAALGAHACVPAAGPSVPPRPALPSLPSLPRRAVFRRGGRRACRASLLVPMGPRVRVPGRPTLSSAAGVHAAPSTLLVLLAEPGGLLSGRAAVPRGLVDRRPAAASPLVRNTEDWGRC